MPTSSTPAYLRDHLAHAVDEGAFSIRWSRAILDEAMATVGIELLTADALLTRLFEAYPSKMIAEHRTSVARLTGATDESTVAALRRAKAMRAADLIEALPEKS